MRKYNVGIIGYGWAATGHIPAINAVPQAQVTGLKTGFTDPAGRCYVTTARIGSHQLGVVLIHSPDPIAQVPALLRAGFSAQGVVAPTPAPPKAKARPDG